jgi:hypothetical protein
MSLITSVKNFFSGLTSEKEQPPVHQQAEIPDRPSGTSFDRFTRNHWDRFVAHLCAFHPLDHEFIAKYEYELDWAALSENPKVNWTLDFIRKYEQRFRWLELSKNSGVTWHLEWIEEFKHRIDFHWLSMNPSVPLTEQFRAKYPHFRFRASDAYVEPGITVGHLNDLDSAMIEFRSGNHLVLYEQVIAPGLTEVDLNQLFEKKFDYSQRYFFMEPVDHDREGLTPEFRIKGGIRNVLWERRTEDLFELDEPLKLITGDLQEGYDRLYEMPRFRGESTLATLLVSENIKNYLQTLKLPPHVFHETEFAPGRIITKTKFYLFHMTRDMLTKDLDYSKVEFKYSVGGRQSKSLIPDHYKKVKETVVDYDSLNRIHEKLRKANEESVQIIPSTRYLTSDYDVYSYSFHDIVVTDKVRKDMEALFPGQVQFKSAQKLNIKMDSSKYEAKLNQPQPSIEIRPLDVVISDEDQFFISKMERLKKEGRNFILPPLEIKDEFSEVEEDLKVRFPKEFKEFYKTARLTKHFKFLDISGFEVTHEYSNRDPKSYKSVLVAWNGMGDNLGLILERGSDYLLSPVVYEFNHEVGRIEVYIEGDYGYGEDDK